MNNFLSPTIQASILLGKGHWRRSCIYSLSIIHIVILHNVVRRVLLVIQIIIYCESTLELKITWWTGTVYWSLNSLIRITKIIWIPKQYFIYLLLFFILNIQWVILTINLCYLLLFHLCKKLNYKSNVDCNKEWRNLLKYVKDNTYNPVQIAKFVFTILYHHSHCGYVNTKVYKWHRYANRYQQCVGED